MSGDPFIAVDWGTTNRRALTIEAGKVTMRTQGEGARDTTDWAGAVGAIRKQHGDHPLLLSGMVGSSIGWRTVPYVPAPAGFDELVAALTWVDDRTAIVPGVAIRRDGGGDVMRGEEMLVLGAIAAGFAPGDALLCQPGTHCKWVRARDSKIDDFMTAMTGELFALLREHSLLSAQLNGLVIDGAAFRAGVRDGAAGDLAASLFAVRAAALLGTSKNRDSAARTSGLLIGNDVAARRDWLDAAPIVIIADAPLGSLYDAAIETLGGASIITNAEAAFVAGATVLWERAA